MGGLASLEEATLCIFSSLLLICLAEQSGWCRAESWAWLTFQVWLKGFPKWREERVTLTHWSVAEEMDPVLWAGMSLETRVSLVLMRQTKNPCLGSTQGDFWPPVVFVPPLRLASSVVSCSPSNSLGSRVKRILNGQAGYIWCILSIWGFLFFPSVSLTWKRTSSRLGRPFWSFSLTQV